MDKEVRVGRHCAWGSFVTASKAPVIKHIFSKIILFKLNSTFLPSN